MRGRSTTTGRRGTPRPAGSTCARAAGWPSTRRPAPSRAAPELGVRRVHLRPGPARALYPRPISPLYANRQWTEWLVQDQRFVHLRPDVLSYESEPLDQDLDVVGPVAGPALRLDQRDRQRLDRQADRRLSRQPVRPARRLSAHDRRRGLPRPVPQELRAARADPGRPGRAVSDRPALGRSPVQEGAQDHGADPEHLVPPDRSQPAEVSSPTSSRRRRRTTRPRPSGSIGPRAARRISSCPSWAVSPSGSSETGMPSPIGADPKADEHRQGAADADARLPAPPA